MSRAAFRRAFVAHVLLNRNVWIIGLVDLCVYVVRYGTLDWTKKFLMEVKGYDPSDAGFSAGLMPVAGVVGVLASGFIADVVFRSRYKAVNAFFKLNESTEVSQLGDLSVDSLTDAVARLNVVPRIALKLLDAQGNSLPFGIGLKKGDDNVTEL